MEVGLYDGGDEGYGEGCVCVFRMRCFGGWERHNEMSLVKLIFPIFTRQVIFLFF